MLLMRCDLFCTHLFILITFILDFVFSFGELVQFLNTFLETWAVIQDLKGQDDTLKASTCYKVKKASWAQRPCGVFLFKSHICKLNVSVALDSFLLACCTIV